MSKNEMLTFSYGFCQLRQYFSCNFEKKIFLFEDIKVTFVSFELHAGRMNVKNMEIRYFNILTFSSTFHRILLWNQGLQSTEYLRCHIGL